MTRDQITLVRALSTVSFPLGPRADRRFARDMARIACSAPETVLTPRQRAYMLAIVHRYRRQIGARVIEMALVEAERLHELDPTAFDRSSRGKVISELKAASAPLSQLSFDFPAGRAGGARGDGTPQAARVHLA